MTTTGLKLARGEAHARGGNGLVAESILALPAEAAQRDVYSVRRQAGADGGIPYGYPAAT
jgi:hypothetical protein